MKLPRTIMIKGTRYKIKVKDLSEQGQYGYCDSSKKEIVLHKRLEPKEAMETFIHEMIHAICSEIGVRQCFNWSIDVEELMAENISVLMVDKFEIRMKR